MFAERPRKTKNGDLRKTCSVAGYHRVDKVSRSDCHTRNGRGIDRGGFEHGGDGVGDAMTWVGSSGCFVPELWYELAFSSGGDPLSVGIIMGVLWVF